MIMSYCDWFLLKKIARQVAVGVSHAIAKSRSRFYFSATEFFVARLVANMGCHTRKSSLQLAMQRHCVARKIATCDMALRRYLYEGEPDFLV